MPALINASGSLASATRSQSYRPGADQPFNIWISGTFSATAAIVRSLDGGVSWVPVAKPDLSAALTFSGPISFSALEPDPQVLWAVSTAVADGGSFTSGTINYYIGS